MSAATSRRTSAAVLGLLYFALVVGGLLLAYAVYAKAFTSTVDVQLRTDSVGSSLQKGSDVKLRGVRVGEVKSISTSDGGAVLDLAIEPDAAEDIPADTTALLVPKTLFGERYVSLQSPTQSGGQMLEAGDVLEQDRSVRSAELQEVLDGLLPLLRQIQPDKLQASLSELATMLRGRGDDLGDTLVAWGDYLADLQPVVPTLAEDLDKLATVADTYDTAAPDLLNALDGFTTTSKTIAAEQRTLRDVYARVIDASETTGSWVGRNDQTIRVLSKEGRKALEAVAPNARVFPCLLRSMRAYIPKMDDYLGEDSKEPGIHVELSISDPERAYQPGTDRPTFNGGTAQCPYTPSSALRSTASQASASEPDAIGPPALALEDTPVVEGGVGQANSPGENQLIAELVAPTQKLAPQDYPAWGSLLLGPVLRDSEVTVR